MKLEKFSTIVAIVIFAAMLLSSIAIFFGYMGVGAVSSGFWGYILNVFAAPAIMLFKVCVGWMGLILTDSLIVIVFFVLGVLGICFASFQYKNANKGFEITLFVLSIVVFVVSVFMLVSVCVFGFESIKDSSVWSALWLVLFMVASTLNLILQIILIHRRKHTILEK